MSRPPIQHTNLNNNLSLSECHPDSECRTNNWWLYDKRAGMNLAMRAKSRDDAFVQTIEYWANRSARYERDYCELKQRLDLFINQFAKESEDE